MSLQTVIYVKRCAECPFYERHIGSVIADLVGNRHKRSGTCKQGGLGLSWPYGRLHVEDENAIPQACPLKAGATTIELQK